MIKRFFVLKNLNKTKVYEGMGKISAYDELVMFKDNNYYVWDFELDGFDYEPGMNQSSDLFSTLKNYKEIGEDEVDSYIEVLRAKSYLTGEKDEN